MELEKLSNFFEGWFIGNFYPTMLQTESFEVSVKRFHKGDKEDSHYQLSATEFTLIVSGECRIGNHLLSQDEIIRIDPFESADFEAITDVVLVAIKTPSIPSDKVLD